MGILLGVILVITIIVVMRYKKKNQTIPIDLTDTSVPAETLPISDDILLPKGKPTIPPIQPEETKLLQ